VCVYLNLDFISKNVIYFCLSNNAKIYRGQERERKKETEEWRRIKSVLYIFFPISLVSLTLTF